MAELFFKTKKKDFKNFLEVDLWRKDILAMKLAVLKSK